VTWLGFLLVVFAGAFEEWLDGELAKLDEVSCGEPLGGISKKPHFVP